MSQCAVSYSGSDVRNPAAQQLQTPAPAISRNIALPSDLDSAAKQLASQRALVSTRITALLCNPNKLGSVELMTALTEELAEDANRDVPLIDFSHEIESCLGGGTLLTLLITVLKKLLRWLCDDSDAARQQKQKAADILESHMLPLITLIRRSNVSLLAGNGETPLALLCSDVLPPTEVTAWSWRLAEALLQAGACVDDRNQSGCTPLMRWIYNASASACGALLLLHHGANIDAQISSGCGVLHFLLLNVDIDKEAVLPALRELAESGYLALADFTLRDSSGQTALQAAHELATGYPEDLAAAELAETLQTQSTMWPTHIRPAALSLLSAHMASDVGQIVLAYVDGRQRASEMQAAQPAAEHDDGEGDGASSSATAHG